MITIPEILELMQSDDAQRYQWLHVLARQIAFLPTETDGTPSHWYSIRHVPSKRSSTVVVQHFAVSVPGRRPWVGLDIYSELGIVSFGRAQADHAIGSVSDDVDLQLQAAFQECIMNGPQDKDMAGELQPFAMYVGFLRNGVVAQPFQVLVIQRAADSGHWNFYHGGLIRWAKTILGSQALTAKRQLARTTAPPPPSSRPDALPHLEVLAALAHEQWAHSTSHILSQLDLEGLGNIPTCIACHLTGTHADDCALERWERQIKTPYADLTEFDKGPHRAWARKVIAAITHKAEVTVFPANLSYWVFSSLDELANLLQKGLESAHEPNIRRLSGVLTDRTLLVLRTGSSDDVRDLSRTLEKALSSLPADRIARLYPAAFAAWETIAVMLAEAHFRTHPSGAAAVLRTHEPYGQQILDLVAQASFPMTFGQLLRTLDITEKQVPALSRILDDLEQHGLLDRRDTGEGLIVRLTPEGRDLATTTEPETSDANRTAG